MKRRDFPTSSAAAGLGLGATRLPLVAADPDSQQTPRQILVAGWGFGTAFIRYMAELTGKDRLGCAISRPPPPIGNRAI